MREYPRPNMVKRGHGDSDAVRHLLPYFQSQRRRDLLEIIL